MPNRIFVLTPDNPCNCTLVDQETDEIWYTVTTEHQGKTTTTKVMDGNDQVIASWKWRDHSSDILTLGNTEPVSASAWLRKSLIPFNTSVSFATKDNAKYTWKGNKYYLNLELYSGADKKSPVAQFTKSTKSKDSAHNPPIETRTPATLTLDERGQEIQDLTVISFLMLEKERRAKGDGGMTTDPWIGGGIGFAASGG
ncbi:hypothetical protein BKA70DRAFT_1135773 [Coprinopsis sp. MPI-PUGE-AT-0042]|nr:hypothetical protein BKA70DRAFT_1135773 [Coprinopsis sp. MPI-PUGE-AT-0042]